LIGKILAGRYEILARVGDGGMAVVYRARDILLGRTVAVKVLRPQFADDAEFIERFQREAQTAASLSHPNVVNIYDVGREDDTHYIVMEFVEGRNLKEIIKEEGALPWKTAAFIAAEICRALDVAHKHHLTHRDVKPHNILITRQDGSVKVTDFGIARAAATTSLTQTGTVIGSVHYISPEQARGGVVGTAADIYSLGVVLYEMVTGKVPFAGENPVSIALKHLHDKPEPPHKVNPAVPLELSQIIMKAMDKWEANRYPSAAAMGRELRLLINEAADDNNSDEATQPLAPIMGEETQLVRRRPAAKSKKRRRGQVWVWLLIACSFIAGLVWAGKGLPELLLGEEVSVPSVVGTTMSEAESILKESGLRMEWRESYHPTVPVNRVIDQDPPAGMRIRKTRPVLVTISRGAELVTVPDVIGLTLREAQISLEAADLKVGEVREEEQEGEPGLVLRQTPAGGSRLAKYGTVDLVIRKSVEISLSVPVPDLRGMNVDMARARLAEIGLQLGQAHEEMRDDVAAGVIIDQSIPADTEVAAGTVIDVIYAKPLNVRSYNVSVRVPEGPERLVKVAVVDEFGERLFYNRKSPGGSSFTVQVTVRRDSASPRYRIYFDQELVEEKPF